MVEACYGHQVQRQEQAANHLGRPSHPSSMYNNAQLPTVFQRTLINDKDLRHSLEPTAVRTLEHLLSLLALSLGIGLEYLVQVPEAQERS